MGSFSTSLSGLNAEEQALSVISNDLSNLNTTAFKSGTPVFSNLFYQMLGNDGAGDPVQVGVGAKMSSVASPFTQGNVSSTGVPTDVAIEGNGLFIVNQNGTQVYTRAGNFTLNSAGNLIDSNGSDVMGYAAVNGAINTSQALSPIVISTGQSYPPNATSTVQLDMNLDAADTSLAPATGTLTVPQPLPTAGQTVSIGGATYTFASTITSQSAAGTVIIGADAASTLANLANAINLGPGAGKTYATSTAANGTVAATGSTATTLNLQALNAGQAGNSDGTSTNWTGQSFASGDLSGGVTAQTANATFAAPSTNPSSGQTIDIDGTTYTFVGSLTGAPNEVLIDASSVATTLGNLVAAMSNDQAQAGTGYSSVAGANPVGAVLNPNNTITLTAPTIGSGGNFLSLAADWGSFAVTDLTGGATGVPASATLTLPAGTAAPNQGDTVTVGDTTYTFENTIGAQSAANDVLIGGSAQTALANLIAAINGGPGGGVDYATGTVQNPAVTVTASTPNTATLQASSTGTGGNATAVSTTWAGALFAGADLAGGVDGQLATGSLTVNQPLPTSGETVNIGGTTYTFVNTLAGLSAANTVLIDPNGSVQTTLANLAGAINCSSSGGQGQGTTYGTGTNPNASVTATGSTETTLSLQALQSGAVGNTTPTTTTWAAASFGAGDLAGGTDAGTYSDSLMVYDSLGNSHVLTFNFTKSSAGDWNYQITIPATDVGASGNPQVVASGALQFDSSGSLISPSENVAAQIANLADGASTLNFNWQLYNSSGTPFITQTAESSATSGKDHNGYSSGTLQSYSIDSSGIVQGVLSNDQTVSLGQIALATFPNYDGLTNLGSNDYQASLASGTASVGTPGSGGRGSLKGSSLEASNVDIAAEFTALIQAERGYEANAKAITTADNVIQSSIALIQG